MKNLWILAVVSFLFLASCKEDRPFFRIDYWEINGGTVGNDSYFAKEDILKIKVSGSTENNDNIDRKISYFSFGYEVDGQQGDAVGEIDQDANNIKVTYILDLQEMIKDGSVYSCQGGELLTLYLEMTDYNGNQETYTHRVHVE